MDGITIVFAVVAAVLVFAIAALARPVPLCGQEEEKEPAEAAAAKVAQKSAATTTAAVKDALDWLEKGVEEREPTVVWCSFTHEVDPLRDHPRFKNVLRTIGLGHLVDREADDGR